MTGQGEKYVMLVVGFASGEPCPIAGEYVKAFDFDAYDGQGEGVFTMDPSEAMRFASQNDALIFWRTVSTARPWRPDGKPNRPLSCATVQIEPLSDRAG